MIGRCQTCRHWSGPDDPEWDTSGQCGRIPPLGYISDEDKAGKLTELAYIIVDLDYGRLATRAGFGCILHEPIEAAG